MEIFTTQSESETATLAAQLVAKFALRRGDIVCLSGKLGAGKSVFARAMIRELCKQPVLDVPSPTFTLVQTYETPSGLVHHLDLYRLKNESEIFDLGWDELRDSGIMLVEWAERLGAYLPEKRFDIRIECDGEMRVVTLDTKL
jgi:tRNA threonylcarbamoyl adenosine modification protein YjeE